jgi:long-chain acyl-CoA synthetase
MDQTLINRLKTATANFYNATALVDESKTVTYEALWSEVNTYAHFLKNRGISKGHIIILSFPNSVELAVTFLALLQIGAVPLIVSDAQEESIDFDELNVFCYLIHPRNTYSIFYKRAVEKGQIPEGANFYLLNNESYQAGGKSTQAALLITSSGSTSRSKVIQLSHSGTLKNIEANIEALGIRQTDATIVALPMNYSYGLIGQFLSHLHAGSKIILADTKFAITQMPKLITKHKVTSLFTAPPMIRQINYLHNKGFYREDFASLRYVTVGGNHIERSSLLKAMKIFNCSFVKTYGLAEAGPRVCTNIIENVNSGVIDSVGEPMRNVTVHILDEEGRDLPRNVKGRVFIESPSVTEGYLNASSDRITPGKSILTEDIGFISEEGRLTVLGRRNEFIKIRSQLIWFRELADVIYSTGYVLKLSIHQDHEGHVEIDAVPIANSQITEESIYLILCENFQVDVWDKFKIRVLRGMDVKVVK